MRNLKKYILIFSIMLILMASCGLVSASSDIGDDNSISADITDMEITDSSQTVELIETSESTNLTYEDSLDSKNVNDKVKTNSKASTPVTGNTFQDIQDAINNANEGDTIELSGTYVGTGSAIELTRSVSIVGIGETTLDAKGLSRIFYSFYTHGKISLINLNLVNGYSSEGAAIWSSGTNGEITNCTFKNNKAFVEYSHSSGGAVYWVGDCNLSIKDCNFINSIADNNAASSSYSSSRGGSIYIRAIVANITNCKFINTAAKCPDSFSTYGGAIYLSATNSSIVNCSFVNSSSDMDGSAIYLCDSINSSLINCSFVNCSLSSSSKYGTVYFETYEGKIINCNFTNSLGAALYISKNRGYVNNCSFVNCSVNSSYSGGAIYFGGNNGTVVNCSFVNCSVNSSYSGGAIYLNGKDNKVINSYFINNTVKDSYEGNVSIYFSNEASGIIDHCYFNPDYYSVKYGSSNNVTIINKRNATLSSQNVSFYYKHPSDVLFLLKNATGYIDNIDIVFCKISLGNVSWSSFRGFTDKNGVLNISNQLKFLGVGNYTLNATLVSSTFDSSCLINVEVLPLSTSINVKNYSTTIGEKTMLNLTVVDKYGDYVDSGTVFFSDNDDSIGYSIIDYYYYDNYYDMDYYFEIPSSIIYYCSQEVGLHNVTVEYKAINEYYNDYFDEYHEAVPNYKNSKNSFIVNVTGAPVKLTIDDISEDSSNSIEISVNVNLNDLSINEGYVNFYLKDNNGNKTINIDGKSIKVIEIGRKAVSDNVAIINYVPSKTGDYELYAVYEGTEKFYSSYNSTTFKIDKKTTTLTGSNLNVIYNYGMLDTLLSVGNEPLENKLINVKISDKSFDVYTNVLGIASFDIGRLNLANGQYTAYISFAGDDIYLPSNATANVYVNNNGAPITNDTNGSGSGAHDGGTKTVVNGTIELTNIDNFIIISLIDSSSKPIANANVVVYVNDEIIYKKTDSNGITNVSINGNSTVKVVYIDNNNISVSSSIVIKEIEKIVEKNNTVYVNVTPKRTNTQIIYQDMVTTAVAPADGRIGKYFEVTLVDTNGKALVDKNVSIGFNGKMYNRTTNATGGVKLQINLAKVDKYTFAIAFLGDDNYTGSFEVALITVNPQVPKLTASAKSFKASAKTKSISATFKTANGNAVKGKQISFTVNGKTYTAKTNSKGVATVKISLNKKGTYSAVAKFAGDTSFKATSTKFNVKIA